ncbi:hypothetical protein VMCG_05302 [Cytospora schulzeri]|uniref:Uncharacterized protein n=1 Tax=Cytospora schulzeri TaxID=448051 RepID=A0A423WQP9_9PEZI|nr:hypothetical protein VMCG_05302 [Valsa malicola]
MASHSNPPSSPTFPLPSPASSTSIHNRLDHIDIPYDLDALAQSEQHFFLQPHDLPTSRAPDNPHPFGVLNSVHLRRLAGRDADHRAATTMQPAAPARVTRRDDFSFPTTAAVAVAAVPANNTETTNTTARTRARTSPSEEVAVEDGDRHPVPLDRTQLNDLVHRAMKPTFPPHLTGVVETRHRSDATTTEHLAGFGDRMIDGVIKAKREYGEGYRRSRTVLLAAQGALAVRAGEVRRVRGALAGEMDCSPKTYLSLHFPEFVHHHHTPPGTIVDPTTPEEVLPPHLLALVSPAWDFSLGEVLKGEKRARLRKVWEAAVMGDWDAVRDMTRGEVFVAEELAGVGVGVGVGIIGGGDGDGDGDGV